MINILQDFKRIEIVQLGCGGTGSWIVPLLSKLLNNIKARLPEATKINYTLIDNDIVEDKNILRQNFSRWDVGKGKAIALVTRFVYDFENMTANNQRIISKKQINTLINNMLFDISPTQDIIRYEPHEVLLIVIGCVDNNKTRHLLYNTLKQRISPIIYIDSGNLLYHGQVITMSFGFNEFLISKLQEQEPDVAIELEKRLKKRKKLKFKGMFPLKEQDVPTQSCLFFGDQSQAINSLSANIIFCNLQKILVLSELPPELISFNSSGYSTFEI